MQVRPLLSTLKRTGSVKPGLIMADQILPKGLRFFNKKDSQPDFVIGAMVITMNELYEFCKSNPELVTEYNGQKQLKLQVLKSGAGNLYAAVDTFKPTPQAASPTVNKPAPVLPEIGDLPF